MGFFRHAKQKHEKSKHEKPKYEAPALPEEYTKGLLSVEKKSSARKKVEKEFKEDRINKAEEEEKKAIKKELENHATKKDSLVKRYETEKKALESFKEHMEKEIKKQNLTVQAIKNLLTKLFGIHFAEPKGKGWSLKGKTLKEKFQPWKAFNSSSNYLFHPVGLVIDVLGIAFHRPTFVVTRKMKTEMMEKIKEREKKLKEILEELKVAK